MKRLSLLLLAGLITLLVACGSGGTGNDTENDDAEETQDSDEIVLDISVTTGPESANALGAEKFIEEVEELTDGAVTGTVYTNNTFGGEREVIEMMGLNNLDMAITSTGPMGTFVPKFNALDLPYLFDNLDHAYTVMDGEIGKELSKEFEEEANVIILGYMENGYRQPTNSVRPIETVEDVKQLKIRTQENEVQLDTWEAYGANPAPVAWPEVFTSLQQGVIDGQANPIDVIYDMNFEEVQTTLAILDDVYSPMPIMISKEKFDSLDEEYQEAIREAAKRAVPYQRDVSNELIEESLEKLEEAGVEITYPDKETFKEKAEAVYDKWVPEFGEDFIEKIRNYEY